jgi:predicted NodU family carbamoyl transferase
MDGDLQDPPELIPEMVACWRAGAEVVRARPPLAAGTRPAPMVVRAVSRTVRLAGRFPDSCARRRFRTARSEGARRAEPAAREEPLSPRPLIGWYQGRMEWGPRALGNRSILADPKRADMKDVINSKIKFREPYRPFAPSVLEEHVSEYFHFTGTSPFMTIVCRVREDKQDEIPAVTHVDGTARIQTVSRAHNRRYWTLIDEFKRLTGVPVVLNTSFNVRGEPIVCTPDDAVRCFLKTDIDDLVLGQMICSR